MDWKNEILSEASMAQRYGGFFGQRLRTHLDRSRIPSELWPLLPYAQFWGLSDDRDRDHLVLGAPTEALENLKAAIRQFDHQLDLWLAGPEADSETPSREYVAFSAMRMAADFA